MPISRMRDSIWIVVPAYNEAETLGAVIERVHAAGLRCLVVDDGSTDTTAEIARQAHADLVLAHDTNRGYSAALRTGLRAAAEQPGCRWVGSVDGDGQLDPFEAAKLADEADAVGVAVAVGIRPAHPRRAEKFAAWMTSRLFGVTDPLCGLKVYRVDIIRRFADACGRRVGMELAVRAAKARVGLLQKPVSTRPSARADSRYGRGVRAELRILAAALMLAPIALSGARA
jgi:glycosyltransferase involved in cell wall biosynthesis